MLICALSPQRALCSKGTQLGLIWILLQPFGWLQAQISGEVAEAEGDAGDQGAPKPKEQQPAKEESEDKPAQEESDDTQDDSEGGFMAENVFRVGFINRCP